MYKYLYQRQKQLCYGSGKNPLKFGVDQNQGRIHGIFFYHFDKLLVSNIFTISTENNSQLLMTKIRYI